MASSLLASIKPFVLAHPSPSRSRPLCAAPRRCSVRAAVAGKKLEPSKVVPQADRVLIRLEELPQKSAGGVLMPKSAVKFERYLMGEILSVGSDASQLEAGKKVLFSDVNAYEVSVVLLEDPPFSK
ncbi:GroES chaperonin family protein [Dioscorea alata]|uniref:GroES chaperonin family protein n=1 Tax=Dioscorea alata TaxID=55571 RepID=A0ACB7WHG7_DIOAL|nr:GroES chaperonin family protein [Dioscorea alata]